MSIFDKPPHYRSYLLTLWEERGRDPDTTVVWRFTLEDPRTGERRGFADLEALVAALRREMSEPRGWNDGSATSKEG
jgi:hypothetical protein